MDTAVAAPHIAIVAGEVSGDRLAAPLMQALKKHFPQAHFSGIGGVYMQEQGLHSLGAMQTLSVMGLAEVLRHLPAIFRVKKSILQYWQDNPPDLFIGIDAPDFNLRIEAALKARGVPTVHYVSPSLWAWKEKRIEKVKQAVDLMLCLFPFETAVYEKHGVAALCVGHPMADRLKPQDTRRARQSLALPQHVPLLGLFPGSRRGEIERLLPIFLRAMMLMQVREPQLRAVISIADVAYRQRIADIIAQTCPPRQEIMLSDAASDTLMSACDVLMLASGTITLEAALLERPMAVAYRVHPLTAKIARRLLKIDRFSLPNLLLKRDVVNEWIQEDCTPEHLADDVGALLHDHLRRGEQLLAFSAIRAALPSGVSERAAQAVAQLLSRKA